MPDAPAGALRRAVDAANGLEIPHLSLMLSMSDPHDPSWLRESCVRSDEHLGGLLAATGRAARSDSPALRGTWLLEAYAGALAGGALLCALAGDVVPDPRARNVRAHFDARGRPDALAFTTGRCAPAASDDAWAWFRRGLVDHLHPTVAALADVTGRGRRALWASVEDACAAYFDWLGGEMGQRERARRWLGLLLGVEPPLRRAARFVPVTGADVTMHVRGGCCLGRLRERDPFTCTTCPLLDPAERRRRVRISTGKRDPGTSGSA